MAGGAYDVAGKKLIVHRIKLVHGQTELHPTLSGETGKGGAPGLLGGPGVLVLGGFDVHWVWGWCRGGVG